MNDEPTDLERGGAAKPTWEQAKAFSERNHTLDRLYEAFNEMADLLGVSLIERSDVPPIERTNEELGALMASMTVADWRAALARFVTAAATSSEVAP